MRSLRFGVLFERTWTDVAIGGLVGASAGLIGADLELPALVSYWGSRAPLVVLVALVFALLWIDRLKPWLIGGALVLSAAWLLIAFTPLTRTLARGLDRQDPRTPVDAVYVLASGVQADGDLTPVALARLVAGLTEAKLNSTPLVIAEQPGMAAYSDGTRSLMANLELDTELITVGPINNSRDEAVAVARLFREQGWSSVAVVTSSAHSRRASAAFEAEGLTVIARPARETIYDFERLDAPDERLRSAGGLFHERIGILYYRLRGWID